MKYLIINADDFGMSREVNEGIKLGMKAGMITSVSVLVNMPFFEDAVAFLKKHPEVSVGLHFNITESAPISKRSDVPNLIREDGNFFHWTSFILFLLFKKITMREIQTELTAQYQKLQETNIPISHIDSHHHIHLFPTLFKIFIRFALEKHVRALRCRAFNVDRFSIFIKHPPSLKQLVITILCLIDSFLFTQSKQFYEVKSLYDIAWHTQFDEDIFCSHLKSLSQGTTEVICHPAIMSKTGNPKFLQPRSKGLSILLSKKVRSAVQKYDIQLTGRVK